MSVRVCVCACARVCGRVACVRASRAWQERNASGGALVSRFGFFICFSPRRRRRDFAIYLTAYVFYLAEIIQILIAR